MSLLRNPELVMDPAGRVELLAPLPACNMLAEMASYLIIVFCQVYPAALDSFHAQLFIPQCFWRLRPCF